MRTGRFFGVSASCFGATGLVAAIGAEHVRTTHDPHTGALLRWLDQHGLVTHNPSAVASMSSASVFSVTDGDVITGLFGIATYLAGTALLFSLLAEYHREDTKHLSIGFLFASAAVVSMNVATGVAISVAVFATLLTIRRVRAVR
jgi:hypothetical protein